LAIGAINLVRGLAHFLTEDSAATEAGISLNHSGASDIIYLFAIIGAVQLIVALFYLYVAVFDTKLIPIALIIEAAKTSLNLFIGFIFKPSQAAIVVGSQQDSLQLSLALLGLVFVLAIAWQTRAKST
jgi:hypothetical protein